MKFRVGLGEGGILKLCIWVPLAPELKQSEVCSRYMYSEVNVFAEYTLDAGYGGGTLYI